MLQLCFVACQIALRAGVCRRENSVTLQKWDLIIRSSQLLCQRYGIHIKWHCIQSVLRIWLFLWFPCLSITEMKTLSHSDRRWHCKGLGGRGGSLVGCCCCRMGHLHSPVCLQQRRRGRGIIPVIGNDGGEGDSSSSLMDEVPFLDEIVKVASSSSSKSLKIIWNSAVIFIPDIWTKSFNRSSQNTSFHFRVLNSTPKFWTKSEILK